MSGSLKPAPLSFNAGRASPFRRPESPLGRSPSTVRAPTPQGSPLKQSTPTKVPFKAAQSTFESPTATTPTPSRPSYHQKTPSTMAKPISKPASTLRDGDPLSSIPPQHLHTMRESFAVLDRSNSGAITPADVAQQLSELGLDSSSSALSSYFPPGNSQSINLATYLNNLSSDLATLTRQDELMAAFSAFDEDDSGQVDIDELRDAVMHTMPEPGSGDRQLSESEVDRVMQGFVGRRAFKKGQVSNSGGLGNKKDVFRYGDFVAGIWGGSGQSQKGADA
jgi:Ca2+-binding EF-hand superfamily protein